MATDRIRQFSLVAGRRMRLMLRQKQEVERVNLAINVVRMVAVAMMAIMPACAQGPAAAPVPVSPPTESATAITQAPFAAITPTVTDTATTAAMPAPVPLLGAGTTAKWWFAFKFNAKTFPGCAAGAVRSCPFGGTPQRYAQFG